MRYEDLPAKARRQIDAALDAVPAPKRSRRSAPVRGGRWRCVACGNVEATLTATERHADAVGHRRYECLL